MGKLKGIIPVEGTVGNITFTRTQQGIIVKQKSSLSASRIARDPAFQRTRENNEEFGNAGKAGKLLRMAFSSTIPGSSDNRHTARLMQRMLQTLKTDLTNVRGKRRVANGQLRLLEKFEFNSSASLCSKLHAPFTIHTDHPSGSVQAVFENLIPASGIDGPKGTAYIKLVMAAALMDLDGEQFETAATSSELMPWNYLPAGDINLSTQLTAGSTRPLFVLLGTEYFRLVKGVPSTLHEGAHNALAIVKVVPA